MRQIQVDQRVRLTHDVPELELHRGEIGLVCSTWFGPATAYEVEFQHELPGYGLRALLMSSQVQEVVSATRDGGKQ